MVFCFCLPEINAGSVFHTITPFERCGGRERPAASTLFIMIRILLINRLLKENKKIEDCSLLLDP